MIPQLVWKRGPLGRLGHARWLFRWIVNGRVYVSECESGAVIVWREDDGGDVLSGAAYDAAVSATREEMRKPFVSSKAG